MSTQPVIGIAGGVGAGKTTVARMLGDLGCVVSHADDDARAVLRDQAVRDRIVGWWGEAMLDGNGDVDRHALGSVVFTDPDARRQLETLTHPRIAERRRELFDAAPADTPALVIDAPLLFEAGLADACDAIIFVDAPHSARLERTQATRGWDAAELDRREEIQLPLDVKRSRADYVVTNDGDLSRVEAQVRTTLSIIMDSHRA